MGKNYSERIAAGAAAIGGIPTSDGGSPLDILFEQRLDGETTAVAPQGIQGVSLVCAADCHVGWKVTCVCPANP